ncbi:hypothetical protein [Roseimaritima ulvae]|uniref:Uncharacterized protein n=1 Tax=Roseimaritima ulvae TaxID=980254 RepID=A0A5B9QV71_9BACT|nr:hypothetical protein [Roseimaritima ulvae]QEG42937.1 hypothetical protein UC8_49790 [Roseimaritima ulvae]
MNPSLPALPDDDDSRCDDDSQRCLLYLFGELDAEAAERFEHSLQHDVELRQRLATEADLIARLGEAPLAEVSGACQRLDNAAASSHTKPFRYKPRVTVAAALVALAASVLCLVWWQPAAHQPSGTAAEQRLQTKQLADAWLVSYGTVRQPLHEPVDAELVDPELIDTDLAADVEQLETLPEEATDGWHEPASPPDWMVAALAGLDAQQHDGTEVSGG